MTQLELFIFCTFEWGPMDGRVLCTEPDERGNALDFITFNKALYERVTPAARNPARYTYVGLAD